MSRTSNLKKQILKSALVVALSLVGLEVGASADTTVGYRGQIYTLYRDNQGQPLVYGNSDRIVTALGGTLISDPVGVVYSNELYIFGIGTDNALYYTTIDRQPWTNLGGWISQITRSFSTQYDVVIDAVGSDGAIYERTLNNGWVKLNQYSPPPPPQYPGPSYNPYPPNYPTPHGPSYNPYPPNYPRPGFGPGDNRGGDNRGGNQGPGDNRGGDNHGGDNHGGGNQGGGDNHGGGNQGGGHGR